MAEKIRLAIVGCGGMGHRHLRGLVELAEHNLLELELVAACDPVTDNAQSLAKEAADTLGKLPAVAASVSELPGLGVQAIDLTSPPALHHSIIEEVVSAGIHVLTEKPVGLTVAAAQRICAAAAATSCVVSVAENYRRDPVNRLARALLDAGVIGDPRLMIMNSVNGQNHMQITTWRHVKSQGGILVDMGVHYGDIMEFFMGPVATVYAQKRLHEAVRINMRGDAKTGALGNPGGAYTRWQAQMPDTFEPDVEDALYGTIVFKNGAVAQFSEDHAGWGKGYWQRSIYGSKGSLDLPHDRTGQTLMVHLDGQEPVSGNTVLDLVPNFVLEPTTAALFGGSRLATYDFEFPVVDRKLLAVEYAEFAGAIQGRHGIEVDAVQGTRALGVIYAMLESAEAGRAVSLAEVLDGSVAAYQAEIDAELNF